MLVGQISYTNTKPFFYGWDQQAIPFVSGTPRELAQLIKNGKLTAAAIPVVECWKSKEKFSPFKNWGIAVNQASHSVFVLSKVPFSDLDQVNVGVTTESYSSVALFDLLIRKKYGHQITMKRGFGEDDAAWLVIGDQALQYWGRENLGRWSHMTDLATEWWDWTGLPCVFARWIIKNDISPDGKKQLDRMLAQSLQEGKNAIDQIALQQSRFLKISPDKIAQYLKGFIYEFGPKEIEAEKKLKELLYDPIKLD